MKTRTILFIALLSFAFAVSANTNDLLSSTPTPISMDNMFILHGIIHNNDKADIMVFEYDDVSGEWFKSESLPKSKEYQLMLNPQRAYQVWFSNAKGYTKVLYIDPGDYGNWTSRLNIDFKTDGAFIHLYQICNPNGTYYWYDFLSEQQCSSLPATNVGKIEEAEDLSSN